MFIGLLIALSALPVQDEPIKIADPAAKKVVQEMFDAYAKCQTYSDIGTVVDGEQRISFATRFRRPDKFYFEFTDDDGRYVLWTTGPQQKVKYPEIAGLPETTEVDYPASAWYGDRKELQTTHPLGLAIAGFTGISGGSAHTVPRMIFPKEIGGLSFGEFADLRIESESTLGGLKTVVLYSKEENARLWIDKKRHLLLRTVDFFGTTQLEPRVGLTIPDSDLTFKPPIEKLRR